MNEGMDVIPVLPHSKVVKFLKECEKSQDLLRDRDVWGMSPFDLEWTESLRKVIYGFLILINHYTNRPINNYLTRIINYLFPRYSLRIMPSMQLMRFTPDTIPLFIVYHRRLFFRDCIINSLKSTS